MNINKALLALALGLALTACSNKEQAADSAAEAQQSAASAQEATVDTGKVQAHYTTARTPDGQTYPVCFVLGSSAPGGMYAEAGSTPRRSARVNPRAP